MKPGARTVAVVLVAAWLVPASAGASPAEADDTRALMREIFAAFATLVQHTDDPEAFASRSERESIVRALQALERSAHQLERHGGVLNESHRPVGRSLTDDVQQALDAFIVGQYESARFLSAQLVESCFACHSKLPADHRFEAGARLLASEPAASLPPERRALLATAARQFDEALRLLEVYLLEPGNPAVEIALSGAFEAYLKLALRVRSDRARALRTLRTFREREDLPLYLEAEVGAWIESLEALDLAAPEGARLARAREQIEAARLLTAYPGDRRGLVQFVVASRWLHQHLDGGELAPEALAETFLWLGLSEVHIGSSLWVSEAESFLERAIRAAPETVHARTAYTVLEAVFLEGYTGSGGTHLPPEVERRLSELRALVEGDPRPAGSSTDARPAGPSDGAQPTGASNG